MNFCIVFFVLLLLKNGKINYLYECLILIFSNMNYLCVTSGTISANESREMETRDHFKKRRASEKMMSTENHLESDRRQTLCKKTVKTVRICMTLFILLCYGSVFSQTPITVTFKPGAAIGQDAYIGTNQVYSWENINYGNDTELPIQAWTWNQHPGTVRSLLKFDELSQIPQNATITYAELRLYGVPNSSSTTVGNSSYPGSPYNGNGSFTSPQYNTTNESFILRVTSSWNEQTVTWNTQPTTTTQGLLSIPNTTSQWNWNFTDNSANLRAMVQDWVRNPATNFGVMMQLQNENYYRFILFASSDNANAALHPELRITYTTEVPEACPCEANFSYMANTAYSGTYTFMAENPAQQHEWKINGETVDENSFVYTLPEGYHDICYRRVIEDGRECEKCIMICVEAIKDDGGGENGEDDEDGKGGEDGEDGEDGETCPCEVNFSYMRNTVEPNTYLFTVSNSAMRHEWIIDGAEDEEDIINERSFIFTFVKGEHQICYRRIIEDGKECEKCITICVEEEERMDKSSILNNTEKTNVIQGKIPPGDVFFDIEQGETIDDNNIKVYPNPTNNEWNIEIIDNISDKVTISVFDINGKLVHNEIANIVAGKNIFTIYPKNLSTGNYLLEIKGNNVNFKKTVVKN